MMIWGFVWPDVQTNPVCPCFPGKWLPNQLHHLQRRHQCLRLGNPVAAQLGAAVAAYCGRAARCRQLQRGATAHHGASQLCLFVWFKHATFLGGATSVDIWQTLVWRPTLHHLLLAVLNCIIPLRPCRSKFMRFNGRQVVKKWKHDMKVKFIIAKKYI